MPVITRMESRVKEVEVAVTGVQSAVSGVNNQLNDHGVLLKTHGVELQSLKEVLNRLVISNGRIVDELASLRENSNGNHGSGRRLQGERSTATGGAGSNGRNVGIGFTGRDTVLGEPRNEFHAQKIELPLFSGDNPDKWAYRAERYFGLQRLSPPEQLEAAVLCLEGAALNWFRWENQRHAINSWEELKSLLLRRFCQKAEGTVFDRFFVHHQVTTVQDYRRRFEALASTIGPMGDQALQTAFLKGLKIEIQAPLRILEPNGLVHMMDLAEQVEANQALTRLHRNGLNGPMRSSPRPPLSTLLLPDSSKGTYVTSPTSSSHSTQLSPGASSKQSSSQATSPVYRRYTESEIQEKKRKGLCFKCDGRWIRGHECSQADKYFFNRKN
ncbi:hypothetical protein G4B88_019159 [Cannabis sativa]|uniref:Retrotransposon gag domain-containing protein n=1 Tax=Cannabis sativa TaxID=3483 RepID=A0A7J6HNQ9_CANSA|nr:hypothetical protein G4B88_019159 [Cannabis sativa]